jgi:hypothetical protein
VASQSDLAPPPGLKGLELIKWKRQRAAGDFQELQAPIAGLQAAVDVVPHQPELDAELESEPEELRYEELRASQAYGLQQV